MASSNLRQYLEAKYATWVGERLELDREIEKIVTAMATLDDKRGRQDQIDRLTAAAEIILSEIHPTWTPDKVKPKRPKVYSLPFEFGAASRDSLDILRASGVPMSSRAVAMRILEKHGIKDADKALVTKICSVINANFRAHRGRITQSNGDYQAKWSIIATPARSSD